MSEETVNEETVTEETVNEETVNEEIEKEEPTAFQKVVAAVAAFLKPKMKPERIQWDEVEKDFKTRDEAIAFAENAFAAFFAEARAFKGRFSFQTLIHKVTAGFRVVLRMGGPRALLARFRQTFLGPKA